MRLRSWRTCLVVALVAAAVLFVAAPVDAQCAMCRAVLNGSNNTRFMRNLNIGVFVLLIPPVTIFCTLFVVLRRHRGDG
jgi:Na+-driven multidrug efflux pump